MEVAAGFDVRMADDFRVRVEGLGEGEVGRVTTGAAWGAPSWKAVAGSWCH